MWPPIGNNAAHSAYNMFSWYKYLIVNLFFSHLGFWSGNLFLIVLFPDRCRLVPFNVGLKTLFTGGPFGTRIYGDLVYKFKKLIRRTDFFFFIKVVIMTYLIVLDASLTS